MLALSLLLIAAAAQCQAAVLRRPIFAVSGVKASPICGGGVAQAARRFLIISSPQWRLSRVLKTGLVKSGQFRAAGKIL